MAGEGVISDRSGTVAWQAASLNDARSALRLRRSTPRPHRGRRPRTTAGCDLRKQPMQLPKWMKKQREVTRRPPSTRTWQSKSKESSSASDCLLSAKRQQPAALHCPVPPLSPRKAQATTLDMPTRDGMARDGSLAKAWQTAGDLNSKREIYSLILSYRYAASFPSVPS